VGYFALSSSVSSVQRQRTRDSQIQLSSFDNINQMPEEGAGHDTDALLGPADDPLRQAQAPGVPGMKLG
jgi:hypothetical protein